MHVNAFPVAALADLEELDPRKYLRVNHSLFLLIGLWLEASRLRGVIVLSQLRRRLLLVSAAHQHGGLKSVARGRPT